MRPLTEEEVKKVFAKLVQFLGDNAQTLLDMEPVHVFRRSRDRVFLICETLLKAASQIPRKAIMSIGTSIGKFTKSGKFHLQVTALEYLSRYGQYKVWLKPQAEGPFLYGNHVLKRYIGKMNETAPLNAGIIVMSATNVPLGFGVLSRSPTDLRNADSETIAVFNQSDIGLYLRKEREIFGGSSLAEPTHD